jgi:hypothetical protein
MRQIAWEVTKSIEDRQQVSPTPAAQRVPGRKKFKKCHGRGVR